MKRLMTVLMFSLVTLSTAWAQKKPAPTPAKEEGQLVTRVFFRVYLTNGNAIEALSFREDSSKGALILRRATGEITVKFESIARNEAGQLRVEEVRIREKSDPGRTIKVGQPVRTSRDTKPVEPARTTRTSRTSSGPLQAVEVNPPVSTPPEARAKVDQRLQEIAAAEDHQRDALIRKLAKSDPGAAEYLADLLDRVDEDKREWIIGALSTDPNAAVARVLHAKLGSKHAEIRIAALRILSLYGEFVSRSALRGALQDPDPTVRTTALNVIEQLEDEESFDALIAACADPDAGVSGRAAVALQALAKKADRIEEAVDALTLLVDRQKGADKAAVLSTLVRFAHKDSAPVFMASVDDDYVAVRNQAIRGLGALKSKEGIPALVDRMQEEGEPAVKVTICDALDKIKVGDLPVLTVLIDALDDEDRAVRDAASRALSHITSQESFGGDKEKWDEWLEKLKEKRGAEKE